VAESELLKRALAYFRKAYHQMKGEPEMAVELYRKSVVTGKPASSGYGERLGTSIPGLRFKGNTRG